jgi:oligosaccharide reducing-end xylanase
LALKGAFYTGEYRNIFKELGYSEDEIQKKLDDDVCPK